MPAEFAHVEAAQFHAQASVELPAEENLAANVRPSVAMLRLVVEFGGIVVPLRLPSDRSSKVPRVCPAPRLKVQ